MRYVVLELSTIHQPETPKDHCRVTKLQYEIINENLMRHEWNKDQSENVGFEGDDASAPLRSKTTRIIDLEKENRPLISLQDAIELFSRDINATAVGGTTLDTPGSENDFTLCSLHSTWDIRVTLPRLARDYGVVLPDFLMFPRIFDLTKEFDRWVNNNPDQRRFELKEAPEQGLTEIAPLFGHEKVKYAIKTLEIDTESASRFGDTYLSTEFLKSLYKRCETEIDNQTVLTRPYDSKIDMDAFIQDRSKLLYMNNLPPDTTQSELESWFTQFGCRPVGFWTVKNIIEDTSNVNNNWSINNSPYVQERDSISGFVVFPTHENALEALKLNGRSILSNVANTKQPRVLEHVIEVQPSSTKVLDKAQEILCPFPQSKNKPRPGDWNCPSCGFSNFQRRTACFRCSFPSPSVQSHNKYRHNSGGPNSLNNGNTTTPSVQPNYMNSSNINGFGTNSTKVVPVYQTSGRHHNVSPYNSSSNSGSNLSLGMGTGIGNGNVNTSNARFNNTDRFNAPYNSNVNMNNNSMSGSGSNVPFRAGDWKCITCTYHNFAKNVVCLRCGGPKMVADIERSLMPANPQAAAFDIMATSTYQNVVTSNSNQDLTAGMSQVISVSDNRIKDMDGRGTSVAW